LFCARISIVRMTQNDAAAAQDPGDRAENARSIPTGFDRPRVASFT
jgi:hypothetical protein